MKSYMQGMITGGVLVFAMFVLMGTTGNDKSDNKEIIDYKLVKYSIYRLGSPMPKSELQGWEIYGSPFLNDEGMPEQAFVKYKN